MPNLIVIPVDSREDLLVFNSTVEFPRPLDSLSNILFNKLYQRIEDDHPDSEISIWGVSAGVKSATANKWNFIETEDLIIFVNQENILGYSIVKTKFQSESVSHYLWPDLDNDKTRPYIVTLLPLKNPNNEVKSVLEKILKRYHIDLSKFEVYKSQLVLDVISVLQESEKEKLASNLGQGFGLNAREKKIVEKYAVKRAIEFLKDLGYLNIQDVGDSQPYDLRAFKGSKPIFVEVKGSISDIKVVILTKNEVKFQKSAFPDNALFILKNISLNREQAMQASGGVSKFVTPWTLNDQDLEPISYFYHFED